MPTSAADSARDGSLSTPLLFGNCARPDFQEGDAKDVELQAAGFLLAAALRLSGSVHCIAMQEGIFATDISGKMTKSTNRGTDPG